MFYVIAINMQLGLQKHYINFSLKKLYSWKIYIYIFKVW